MQLARTRARSPTRASSVISNSMMQLPETRLIGRPQQRHKEHRAERAEPVRLVVRRGDGELQGIALLVPHPAVVAGDHAKAVGARSEGSSTARWRSLTTSLQSLSCPSSLYLKLNLLRRDEAESGVVDLQIASPRRQTHVRNCRAR